MLLSWLALLVSVLGWWAPLVYLSGGFSAYRAITQLQFVPGVYPSSVFAAGAGGLELNTQKVWQAALWLLGLASVMLAISPASS
jgi:hypothetical protein